MYLSSTSGIQLYITTVLYNVLDYLPSTYTTPGKIPVIHPFLCSSLVLSLFNLVRFVNEECQSSQSQREGICYTQQECANLNGIMAGSCAAG